MSAADHAQRRAEGWGRATIEGVLGDLASTMGGRNVALRNASIRLGALVGRGILSHDDAASRLLAAAVTNGTVAKRGERDARSTIARGLRYGAERGELPLEIEDALRVARFGPPTSSAPERAPAPVVPLEVARPLPPSDEAVGLWRAAGPVDEDREVAGYLLSRGIDPVAVAERNLARALPPDVRAPEWASRWPRAGYRLIVPLCDASGALRSLVGRALVPDARPKNLAPTGYRCAGLVFAEGLARRMLEGPGAGVRRVLVTEGEVDFLTAAAQLGEADDDTAIVGVRSGAWTPEHAARIPDGAEVVIATDSDEQGDAYARHIRETLRGRAVRVGRVQWGSP